MIDGRPGSDARRSPLAGCRRPTCKTPRVASLIVTALGFLLPAVTLAAEPLLDLEHEMRVTKIASDAYVVTDRDYFWSNTLVTRMPDGTVLLVSSPYEDLGTATLLKWVRAELKPEQIVAVNSHFHLDGTGGNSTFRKEGVVTWASSLTVELQTERLQKTLDDSLEHFSTEELRQRVLDTDTVTADRTFDLERGKRLEFGGEPVELFFPGHAHSPDNLAVWFPERRILFGGCIVKPGDSLGYIADADVAGWSATVNKLLEYPVEIVVPGHGKAGGVELLERTLRNAERASGRPGP